MQLNVDPDELSRLSGANGSVQVRIGERVHRARRVTAFEEVPTGGLGLAVDSYGLVALVAARASAADQLGVGPGDAVVLIADVERAGITTPVDVGRRLGVADGLDEPVDEGS